MSTVELQVRGPADRLLRAGLFELHPALLKLRPGALVVVGGLACKVWIEAFGLELPSRATTEIDLGLDRRSLGVSLSKAVVGPILKENGFGPLPGPNPFRFKKNTSAGEFIVDLLVAPGASRADPPFLEPGITSLAAPGLAYGLLRGPTEVEVVFVERGRRDSFRLPVATVDAMFVLKAALGAQGLRQRADRQITDTVDAIMLARCVGDDDEALNALRSHSRRRDVRQALAWANWAKAPKSAAQNRFRRHFETKLEPETATQFAAEALTRLVEGVDRKR